MASASDTEATPKPRGNTRLLSGLALVLGVVLAFLVFFSHRGLYQISQLKQEKLRLDQETARMAEENTRLARTIHRLQDDPVMIQDLIRRELNFVKKNEVIVQLAQGVKGRENLSVQPPAQPAQLKGAAGTGGALEGRKKQGARKAKQSQ